MRCLNDLTSAGLCACHICFEVNAGQAITSTACCSTANELDKIMSLVFDAERYLKNITMGGEQYRMAADNLRKARVRYMEYRAKP